MSLLNDLKDAKHNLGDKSLRPEDVEAEVYDDYQKAYLTKHPMTWWVLTVSPKDGATLKHRNVIAQWGLAAIHKWAQQTPPKTADALAWTVVVVRTNGAVKEGKVKVSVSPIEHTQGVWAPRVKEAQVHTFGVAYGKPRTAPRHTPGSQPSVPVHTTTESEPPEMSTTSLSSFIDSLKGKWQDWTNQLAGKGQEAGKGGPGTATSVSTDPMTIVDTAVGLVAENAVKWQPDKYEVANTIIIEFSPHDYDTFFGTPEHTAMLGDNIEQAIVKWAEVNKLSIVNSAPPKVLTRRSEGVASGVARISAEFTVTQDDGTTTTRTVSRVTPPIETPPLPLEDDGNPDDVPHSTPSLDEVTATLTLADDGRTWTVAPGDVLGVDWGGDNRPDAKLPGGSEGNRGPFYFVSRQQARFDYDGTQWSLTHLTEQKRKTFVTRGGERVTLTKDEPYPLEDGDEITFIKCSGRLVFSTGEETEA